MSEDNNYILDISKDELAVLNTALDLYSRLGAGQFEYLMLQFSRGVFSEVTDGKYPVGNINTITEDMSIREIRDELFPSLNGHPLGSNLGVLDNNTHKTFKTSLSMRCKSNTSSQFTTKYNEIKKLVGELEASQLITGATVNDDLNNKIDAIIEYFTA